MTVNYFLMVDQLFIMSRTHSSPYICYLIHGIIYFLKNKGSPNVNVGMFLVIGDVFGSGKKKIRFVIWKSKKTWIVFAGRDIDKIHQFCTARIKRMDVKQEGRHRSLSATDDLL